MQAENILFNRIKEIHRDTSLYDYGGGAILSKCYVMAYLASHYKLKNYVEIGVYKGRSLFSVTQAFKDNGGKAYGIDAYCLEEAKEYDLEESLKQHVNHFLEGIDFEAMYRNVLKNIEKFELSQVVKIIKKTSASAASDFKNIKIDMLHIDGNHDRKKVQEDIKNYVPLVTDGGIVVFDAIHWDSVKYCYDQMKKECIPLLETAQFGILMKKGKTQKNLDNSALIAKKLINLHTRLVEIENNTTVKRPTVNVGVLAYNHEKYITECLNSIITQKGEFDLKVIICEDKSTDHTSSIIENYIKSTPVGENITFEYLKGKDNLGMVKNLKRVLRACRGSDYTALMDGDDYWLDDHKIQKHIEFMESHPECALSFDSIMMHYENEERQELYNMQQETIGNIFTTPYILERYIIGNISCCFYYGKYLEQIPDQFFEMFVGDWMLNIFYSQFGDIGYIRYVMTLYRKHSKGLWSGMDVYERNKKTIECIDDYNKFLNYTYDEEFSNTRHQFAHRRDHRYLESYDLVIIDDVFPQPENSFRYQEFVKYFQSFSSIKILTTGFYKTDNAPIIAFKRKFPQVNGKLAKYIALDYIECKLLYFASLKNAAAFADVAGKRKIPFIFTLYPDVIFQPGNTLTEQMLKKVVQSPAFKKVIVTQKAVYDYLVNKKFCRPEQIQAIFDAETEKQIAARIAILKGNIQ